jgi:hypothetical protein
MILYFLLVIILGIVLRFISTVGLTKMLMKNPTDSDLRSKPMFHVLIGSYCLGIIMKYVGITLTLAFLIHKHILS